MRYDATAPSGQSWRTPAVTALLDAIVRLETIDEAAAFLRDLCTLGELHDLAQRWAVVRLLDAGLHYAEISTLTGASTATITRIAQWLHNGEGGYQLMLERTPAVAAQGPAKGSPAVPGASADDLPRGSRPAR